jgi:hypothetical protein
LHHGDCVQVDHTYAEVFPEVGIVNNVSSMLKNRKDNAILFTNSYSAFLNLQLRLYKDI